MDFACPTSLLPTFLGQVLRLLGCMGLRIWGSEIQGLESGDSGLGIECVDGLYAPFWDPGSSISSIISGTT